MDIAILLAACALQFFCLYRLLLRIRDLERRVEILRDSDEMLAQAICGASNTKGVEVRMVFNPPKNAKS